uniref:Uncharacterized protein n=1 Tax=viral metagenome TaxID=1070528 RepID=A0A6H1ZIE5_9ZZZZ
MTIYVKSADGGLQVVDGLIRLKAMLEVQGSALVQNVTTGEMLEVHEVGGEVVALTPSASASVRSAAADAILNAAKR